MGKNEIAKPSDIRALISSDVYKRQFAMALPKHLKPERFIRIALTALTRTPKLAECTQASLVKCLLDLSALGLEPDGRKAHLIPYGDQCTLIIDYKGYVELARRSGEIADIHADVVGENDDFQYSFGTDGKLVHKPALKDRGEPVAAYSFVRLKDGSSSYEVMNIEEIEAIHKRSKAKDNGPWKTDWAEMAKKTVFRRHSKWLPLSAEFQEAVEKDFDVPIDMTPKGKPEVIMPEAVKEKEEVVDLDKDTPISEQQIKMIEGLAKKLEDEKVFEIFTSLQVNTIAELTQGNVKEAIEKFTKAATSGKK